MYIVQGCNIDIFQLKFVRKAKVKICTTRKQEETGVLVSTIAKLVIAQTDIEKTMDEFYGDLTTACNESLKTQLAPKKATTKSSVLFWTDELTIVAKY